MNARTIFVLLQMHASCFFVSFILAANCAYAKISLKLDINDVSVESYRVTTNNSALAYSILYNGSVHIFAVNGLAPYTYNLISPFRQSESSANFSNLAPGVYIFEVTDALGQIADTTITVGTIYAQPFLSVSGILPPSSCTSADGGFTLNGAGGTPPYTYSIDGGATFTANNTFTNLTQGYYPFLLLKDANGFLAEASCSSSPDSSNYFPVGVCSFAVFADLAKAVSCSDTSGVVTLSASGGTAPIQFSQDGVNYYPGSLIITNGVPLYQYTFAQLAPGLHSFYGKDANGAVAVASAPVAKECRISITYVATISGCKQSNGTLTVNATDGTPPYAYSLDGVKYQPSNIFTGLGSTLLLTIWVKDANGTINNVDAVVYQNCPNVSAIEVDETCGRNDGVIVTTSYGGTRPFLFSINNGGFQPDSTFTGLSAGDYPVAVKDSLGFISRGVISIDSTNCLKISAASTNEGCHNKNGTITVTVSGGVPPFQYSLDSVTFQSSNFFTGLHSGAYTIFVKDAHFFTNTTAVSLTDATGPVITSTSVTTASCTNTGGSITVSASGGTLPLRYSIDGVNYQDSNIFSNDSAGVYLVTVKDTLSCTAIDTAQVEKYPVPTAFIGRDTSLCMGQTLVLNAPAGPQYQYQWQNGTTGNTYTAVIAGVYWLKVTNQFGCSSSDTVKLQYLPLPAFSLGGDTLVCSGQVLTLRASVQGASYLWSTGSTLSSLSVKTSGQYWLSVSDSGCVKADTIQVGFKPLAAIAFGNDTTLCVGQTLELNAFNNNALYLWQDGSSQPTYTVTGPGIYWVTVTLNGCDTTGKIKVGYIARPVVNIGNDTTICTQDQLVLDAAYPNAEYLWQNGSTEPTFTVTKAGGYYVFVSNICGIDTASVRIQYENCACKFYMPAAFTPNGDGKNDMFRPSYHCLFSNYQMRIFNRFGQNIFGSQNADNGWDGTIHGLPQTPGVYIWEIEYLDTLTGRLIKKSGTLVLAR